MNSYELRKQRFLNGELTMKDMAEAVNLKTEQAYRNKENGLFEFKAGEMKTIIKKFNLTPGQVNEIFFDGEIPSWEDTDKVAVG